MSAMSRRGKGGHSNGGNGGGNGGAKKNKNGGSGMKRSKPRTATYSRAKTGTVVSLPPSGGGGKTQGTSPRPL